MTVIEIESAVRSVTVYRGRAMITREAAASLGSGDHILVFPGLPADLDRDSLQVKGIGDAVLGNAYSRRNTSPSGGLRRRRP